MSEPVRTPETTTAAPTFVFVHGLASNSFFWTPVIRELALLGHRSLPVDLPGHGLDARIPLSYQAPQDLAAFTAAPSPMAGITVAHVVDVVRTVRRHGPVVLVGARTRCPGRHSFQLALGRSRSPRGLPADQHARGHAGTGPGCDQLRHAARGGRGAHTQFADARVHAETWGCVPRSYIRLTRDNVLSPDLVTKMIDDADRLTPDNRFDVHTLSAGHVGVILRAREPAAGLDRLA
ncbi:hypothetical protein NLM24_11545 [Nocardia zapadnayensis]|uniref:hypothetical protein n=1 Tax=Nocardia rhamnosiphila TaxID=426716 RepID=UPI0022467658|nr:hypothetical protein [Nocardia zapadnayensis]MCX0271327.1 hypothetical protein [Nocardia zapadnayensis]